MSVSNFFGHTLVLASVKLQADSLGRTNTCARATLDTLVRIDYIDVAGSDSLYRTLIDASTARDTRIWNFVSHNDKLC